MRIRLSSTVVILAFAAMVISHRLDSIRIVDFMQIFAGGMAFGVLLVNVIMLRKLKSGK